MDVHMTSTAQGEITPLIIALIFVYALETF